MRALRFGHEAAEVAPPYVGFDGEPSLNAIAADLGGSFLHAQVGELPEGNQGASGSCDGNVSNRLDARTCILTKPDLQREATLPLENLSDATPSHRRDGVQDVARIDAVASDGVAVDLEL